MSDLFGEAELFASIADEWDMWLRAKHPGSIRYFKMDEACTLDREFGHWQPKNRDAKVWQMAKLINRDDLLEIAARIDLKHLKQLNHAGITLSVSAARYRNFVTVQGVVQVDASSVLWRVSRGPQSA